MTLQEALKIFKLKEDYTYKDVEKVFKKLCLKYHPDRNKAYHNKFIEILEAREVLLKNLQYRDLTTLIDRLIQRLTTYKQKIEDFKKLKDNLTSIDFYFILLKHILKK